MGPVQQKNVSTWSCPRKRYLPADLTYEVTQERGYYIARLRFVEYLESPFPSTGGLSPQSTRGNIIAFPERPQPDSQYSENMWEMVETWLQYTSLPSNVIRMPVKGDNLPAVAPPSMR